MLLLRSFARQIGTRQIRFPAIRLEHNGEALLDSTLVIPLARENAIAIKVARSWAASHSDMISRVIPDSLACLGRARIDRESRTILRGREG